MCQLDDLLPIAQIAQWLSKEAVAPAAKAKLPSPTPSATSMSAVAADAEKKKLGAPDLPTSEQSVVELTPDSLPQIWQQVLAESGFALQAELRKGKSPAISGPNALVLSVSRRYNAPGSVFLDPARLAKVQEILGRIVGAACSIRVEWIDEPTEATSNPSAAKSSSAQAMGQQRQQRAEWMQIPFVKKATDVLGAQIMRADEGFGTAASAKAAEPEAVDVPETPAAPEEE
jgi:hypothetical protein